MSETDIQQQPPLPPCHGSEEQPERQKCKNRSRRRTLLLLLLLLLLLHSCELLLFGAPTASVIIEVPLSEDMQKLIGDDVYESPPVFDGGGRASGVGRGEEAEVRSQKAEGRDSEGEGGGGGSADAVPSTSGWVPVDAGAGVESGRPGQGGREDRGGGEGSVSGAEGTSGLGLGEGSGGEGGQGTGGGQGSGGQGGDGDGGAGGQGPDRRGGGGGGGGGGGSGGGSSGSGDGGDGGGGERTELDVKLRAADGRILSPRYRFAAGNGELILEERRFTPGLYRLIVTKRFLVSGREETADQEFAWGVLALNTDQDRYRPGEIAHVAIGVLDDLGAIVCDADLTLTVTNPEGVVTAISTEDGGIRITGTCGIKEAGFINPDFEAFLTMNLEGTYRLELVAENFLGSSHKLTSDVQVVSSPPFVVHRNAATRLWPFAPSPMTIDVEFFSDFSGTITDTVPEGFGILETTPEAQVVTLSSAKERQLTWSGSWTAGQTVRFAYRYDAPDVSPEFYLVGPLAMIPVETDRRSVSTMELRQWQIANDNEGRSATYRIPSDVQAAGGGELALSTNYKLSDTIGETIVGLARSALYSLSSGYRQTISAYMSISCGDPVSLGTLATAVGQLTGTTDCTVIADGGGYSLSWRGGAPTSGLVGYWKLDETSGTAAYDLSGYGNNGTHYGTPTISTTVPSTHFSTRSLSFDGTDDYVDAGTKLSSITQAVSISAWVNPGSTQVQYADIWGNHQGDYKGIVMQQNSSSTNEYYWGYGYGTDWKVTGNFQLTPGTWSHVIARKDSSYCYVFVNGVEQVAARTSCTQDIVPATVINFRLAQGFASGGRYFNGSLDEVRIFNRALSTGEILQLASTGPSASMVSEDLDTIPPMEFPSTGGLVGHWKFDEIAGSVAADSSGNGNSGTHENTPTISTSLPSDANIENVRSLSFDGTDDYVRKSNASFAEDPGTISLWFKANSINAEGGETYQKMALIQYGDIYWGIQISSSTNKVQYHYYDGAARDWYSTGTISTGQWYHLAVVSTAGGSEMFLNGTSQGTSELTFFNNICGASCNLDIGGNIIGFTSGDSFNGLLDDVRIYNRALSAAEIKALAAIPQTWSIPTTSAYWGGRLSSTSTDTDAKWGTDSSTDKWLAVGNGDYTVVSRAGRTAVAGSTETVQFRVEVGADKVQHPGTYQGAVTLTVTAL